jgi:hypothetical protein
LIVDEKEEGKEKENELWANRNLQGYSHAQSYEGRSESKQDTRRKVDGL